MVRPVPQGAALLVETTPRVHNGSGSLAIVYISRWLWSMQKAVATRTQIGWHKPGRVGKVREAVQGPEKHLVETLLY
jgi:hypothetical protein